MGDRASGRGRMGWGLKMVLKRHLVSRATPGRASELVSDGAGGSAAVVHTTRV